MSEETKDSVRSAITIDTIDISNPEKQAALGISTQAELEALFSQIDRNLDGELDYNEACRHYVSNNPLFCPSDRQGLVTDPDFYTPTEFDHFWWQFDEDHMSVDLNAVEREDWIEAVAEVNMFSEMTAEEVAA